MTDKPPPRPPFKVSGLANIKHLNVRKEGPDDEKILAVDIKLEIKGIDRRLCAYFDDALEGFLWRGNSNALIVRNAFMAPAAYSNCISDCRVEIGLGIYHGCDVKKFAIQPHDGGVITLICAVTLQPTASEVSDLAKLVQDDADVVIEGPPDLFAADPVPGSAMEAAAGLGELLEGVAMLDIVPAMSSGGDRSAIGGAA